MSIAIGLRTGADHLAGAPLPTLAGIRLLAPDDQLVTFEDFELGVPGWEGGVFERPDPAFGGMLGRFGGTGGEESISRTYQIAPGAVFAIVSFDLHAIDEWALEDAIVFVNDVEVLRRNFTTDPAAQDRQRTLVADLAWVEAELSPGPRPVGPRGFADTGPETDDQTVRVRLLLISPPEELRIGFGATLPDADTSSASWGIDNFQIVTSQRPPAR